MNEIVNYDKTRYEIDEAKTVDTVLVIRNKMEALVKIFSRKADPEQERAARELHMLSMARIGEMSLTLKKESPPGTKERYSAQGGVSTGKIKTLKSAGITTQQASDYERLYAVKDQIPEAARKGKGVKSILSKKKGETPEVRARSSEIVDLAEQGLTAHEIAGQIGVTPRTVRRTIDEERIRKEAVAEAEPLIEASIFSMSVQEKIETWKRQQLKRMEREFEERVRIECHKQMEETFLPYYKEKDALHERIVMTRKGMMTRQIYNKIRSCLHPDRVQDTTQKKLYEESFRLFNDLELVFLDEKELRTATGFRMPSTMEEWTKMRKNKSPFI